MSHREKYLLLWFVDLTVAIPGNNSDSRPKLLLVPEPSNVVQLPNLDFALDHDLRVSSHLYRHPSSV